MSKIIVTKQDHQNINPIYRRETQLIALLSEGFSKQIISRRLCIEVSTVATHVKSIYRKMEVDNAAGAISKAYRCGVLFLV